MKKQTSLLAAFAASSLLNSFPAQPNYTQGPVEGSPGARKRRIKRKTQRKARRTNRK